MLDRQKNSEQNTFYVTTPIYYVTAKPHLGSLYSTVLADIAARWHALKGQETFFLTGTDEHGQKVAQAAHAAGMSNQAFVDSFIPAFKKTWDDYAINYTHFIRTTDSAHAHGVIQWIEQLKKTGTIYKGFYTGWYCTPCETFVTQEITDQQSVPLCTSCARATHTVKEETYFFKLSAYQDALLDFYDKNPDFITPKERFNEVISFVKAGLKDLSISRTTLSWGIPFPGDPEHVVYVWADALMNYLTGIGYANAQAPEAFKKWWPAQLHVLGKDIVRFHAVYWPAFLFAASLTPPHKLLVHGWIKVDNQKMSKSFGNVIDPLQLLATYGADPVRYYLARYLAVTQDAEFSLADLEQKISSDLANDLGNLLNRILLLAAKYETTKIPAPVELGAAEQVLHKNIQIMLQSMQADFVDYLFHKVYGHVWKALHEINAYFHAQEPWKIVKTDKKRFEEILSAATHALAAVATVLTPVMPTKMAELLQALGVTLELKPGKNHVAALEQAVWNRSFTLTQTEALFTKYEQKEVSVEQKITEQTVPVIQTADTITIADFAKIELRIGTIIGCEPVAKSDKLYSLQVDFGECGTRQILSGVRQHFTPEELLGKQGTFVFNLQPRPMMGTVSHGMMLFGQNQEKQLVLVTVEKPVPNGTKLS
jgi:methionyl-tRNA synthetase